MDFETLQVEHNVLQEQYAVLENENETLSSALDSERAEKERLQLIVKKLQHKLFGKSSERRIGENDPRQCSLFDIEPEQKRENKEVPIQAHTRRVKSDFSDEEEAPEGTFPEHLPREERVIDEKPEGIADDDLELVSSKVTERLASRPEQHRVVRIVRRIYKQKSTGKFFTPPAPEHVLDRRCKVDESFLVLMIIKKYLWHMPLYRQQQELKLQGIKLSRDRMVSWALEFGSLLRPIAESVAELIRESELVHCDETPIVVGKGKKRGEKKYQDGYLWPILAAGIGVAFLYRPTRAWKEVYSVLEGFTGTLVSDALDAYENYIKTTKNRWQLCWMHIRRYFVEAEGSNPELARVAIGYIRQLYAIETEIREKPPDIRLRERLTRSRPILDEFKKWLLEHSASPQVITDDALAKAFSYVLKRWEAACLFIYDGEVPIDNGAAERAIRPVKLGAKNWLHCASEEGAQAAAVFYTLIASALMQGIHPYYYLLDLTRRLDDPKITPEDLVPHNWKKKFYQDAVPEEFRNLVATGAPFVGDPNKVKKVGERKA